MKAKQLLLALVPATLMALATACSDYDNGFTEKDLKYVQDFKAAYGDIDPDQDWNLAERSSVTVTTDKESNVKIFALTGGEYCLVGSYTGVMGEQKLGIDIAENVESLMVTDGKTVQQTVPGGSVSFSGTRTVYEGTTGLVKVEKITQNEGVTIGGVNYPKYRYSTGTEMTAVKEKVPEIGHRTTYTNLNNVTHDFSYVSTGKFVIYPLFWHTSSMNTLGVYYYDANGVRKEVDIYKIKEGDELMYESVNDAAAQTVYSEEANKDKWYMTGNGDGLMYNTWSTEADQSGLKTPFMQYWRGTNNILNAGTIRHETITGLTPGSYRIQIDVRAFNEGDAANPKTDYPQNITFTANGKSIDFCSEGNQATYNTNSTEVYYINLTLDCEVDADGNLDLGFDVGSNSNCDWLAWKNLRVLRRGDWVSTANKGSFGNIVRAQGIVVDIEPGTKFGMYLKAGTDQSYSTFYSESELNSNLNVCGYGVRDDGQGNVTLDQNLKPCYASTFHANGQMYLGFEDWPNTANESDFDLNDLVLAFSGATPTIINEDPTPAATWFIACEDLGGTFDTDYNDVIFKVEHVSGQTHATITPMAAGGTLASYLFFEDPTTNATEICFGEIHQLFGVEPMNSGYYSPINVGASRGNPGQSKTFTVSENWTLAHYTSEDFDINSQYSKNGKEVNMGGFAIYVLPEGVAPLQGQIYSTNGAFGKASIIAAPGTGDAPMMVCFPYTYIQGEYTYAWAWPRELCTIADGVGGGAYPQFAGWVGDHTQNTDWYKYPNINTVSELKWKTETAAEAERLTPRTEKLTGGFLNAYAQVVKPRYKYINQWGTDTNDHSADIYIGNEFQIVVKLADGATGAISLKAWNAEKTDATYSVSYDGDKPKYTISNINKTGTIKMTLHYEGDANYAEQDINYTLKVNDCQYVHFTTTDNNSNKFVLTWNEDLKLEKDGWYEGQTWSNGIKQEWALEASGDGDYFYMLNLVENKYLYITDNDIFNVVLKDAKPKGAIRGKFMLDEQGRLYPKVSTTRFFGAGEQPAHGVLVRPGKDPVKSGQYCYSWTIETVTF